MSPHDSSSLNDTQFSKPIQSIVTIVTLQVTGIPVEDPNRNFPWPKPKFISKPPTRSSAQIFDVSLFVSGESDFIMPLDLYLWRVQQLEEAAKNNKKGVLGLAVRDFFFEPQSEEDASFEPYQCRISKSLVDNEDKIHFQRSGYNSLVIRYRNADDLSLASPWDVSLHKPSEKCPLPSCLTSSQEEILIQILDSLEEDVYVINTFSSPVDTRRYVDYLYMIEVPMDLSTIRKRLKNQYYTNIQSVKSDVQLILDNCKKYNKNDSDVSIEANNMYKKFLKEFEEKLQDEGTVRGTRNRGKDKIDDEESVTHNTAEASKEDRGMRSTRTQEPPSSPENTSNVATLSDNHEDEDNDEPKLRVIVDDISVILSEGVRSDEEFVEEGNYLSDEDEYVSDSSDRDNGNNSESDDASVQNGDKRQSRTRNLNGSLPAGRTTRGKNNFSQGKKRTRNQERNNSTLCVSELSSRRATRSNVTSRNDKSIKPTKITSKSSNARSSPRQSSRLSKKRDRHLMEESSLENLEATNHRAEAAQRTVQTPTRSSRRPTAAGMYKDDGQKDNKQSTRIRRNVDQTDTMASAVSPRRSSRRSISSKVYKDDSDSMASNRIDEEDASSDDDDDNDAGSPIKRSPRSSSRGIPKTRHSKLADRKDASTSAVSPRRSSRRSISSKVYKDDSDSMASNSIDEEDASSDDDDDNDAGSPIKSSPRMSSRKRSLSSVLNGETPSTTRQRRANVNIQSTCRKALYQSPSDSNTRSSPRRGTNIASYHEDSHSDLDQSDTEGVIPQVQVKVARKNPG